MEAVVQLPPEFQAFRAVPAVRFNPTSGFSVPLAATAFSAAARL